VYRENRRSFGRAIIAPWMAPSTTEWPEVWLMFNCRYCSFIRMSMSSPKIISRCRVSRPYINASHPRLQKVGYLSLDILTAELSSDEPLQNTNWYTQVGHHSLSWTQDKCRCWLYLSSYIAFLFSLVHLLIFPQKHPLPLLLSPLYTPLSLYNMAARPGEDLAATL
jgi:hypothetical protein